VFVYSVSYFKVLFYSVSVSDVSEGAVLTVFTFSLARHEATVKNGVVNPTLFLPRRMALFYFIPVWK
jgi:hypothetical protein